MFYNGISNDKGLKAGVLVKEVEKGGGGKRQWGGVEGKAWPAVAGDTLFDMPTQADG